MSWGVYGMDNSIPFQIPISNFLSHHLSHLENSSSHSSGNGYKVSHGDIYINSPYKRDFTTLNKLVINSLPMCTYHLLYSLYKKNVIKVEVYPCNIS